VLKSTEQGNQSIRQSKQPPLNSDLKAVYYLSVGKSTTGVADFANVDLGEKTERHCVKSR
jgi:hypothetical protein